MWPGCECPSGFVGSLDIFLPPSPIRIDSLPGKHAIPASSQVKASRVRFNNNIPTRVYSYIINRKPEVTVSPAYDPFDLLCVSSNPNPLTHANLCFGTNVPVLPLKRTPAKLKKAHPNVKRVASMPQLPNRRLASRHVAKEEIGDPVPVFNYADADQYYPRQGHSMVAAAQPNCASHTSFMDHPIPPKTIVRKASFNMVPKNTTRPTKPPSYHKAESSRTILARKQQEEIMGRTQFVSKTLAMHGMNPTPPEADASTELSFAALCDLQEQQSGNEQNERRSRTVSIDSYSRYFTGPVPWDVGFSCSGKPFDVEPPVTKSWFKGRR